MVVIAGSEIMTGHADSGSTAELQFESLELDIKTLQRDREEDRKEFQQFQAIVNRNFATMQKNFDKIQDNFRRLLLESEPAQEEGMEGQGSVQMKDNQVNSPRVAPGRPTQLQAPTPPSMAMPEKGAPLPIGTAVLRDRTGKELNMDGTPKVPYRHPHYGQNKEKEHLQTA